MRILIATLIQRKENSSNNNDKGSHVKHNNGYKKKCSKNDNINLINGINNNYNNIDDSEASDNDHVNNN